jgi:hypothetical protein
MRVEGVQGTRHWLDQMLQGEQDAGRTGPEVSREPLSGFTEPAHPVLTRDRMPKQAAGAGGRRVDEFGPAQPSSGPGQYRDEPSQTRKQPGKYREPDGAGPQAALQCLGRAETGIFIELRVRTVREVAREHRGIRGAACEQVGIDAAIEVRGLESQTVTGSGSA